jgi:crotonobetainyl-CoA:carnitine CoA-transferase CaiB-like acyl-CoA transferase
VTEPSAGTQPARRPLDGIRVLDWSEGVAGPYACVLMADLGADVIKVERPQGDWGRTSGPGGGHHFRAFNRNKRNLCIDLSHSGAKSVAHRLIERADVIVTAYRPGVTERLGIGYEQVKELNPSLVYVRISAYGYQGPLAKQPGSDTILQAVSGLMSQIGDPDGDPQRVGVPVIDFLAARDAVIGAMGGLLTRVSGASPDLIDVSLFASAASYQAHLWQTFFDLGTVQQRSGHRNPSLAPAGLYATQDGRHVAVAVLRDEHFVKLCAALDLSELAADQRFITNELRLKNREALEAIITPAFASKPFDEWGPLLVEFDVLAGPLMRIPEIAADQAMFAAVPIVEVVGSENESDGRALGSPLSTGGGAIPPSRPSASRGRHTRAVLSEVGYSAAEIDDLVASGITPDGEEGQQ